MTLKKIFLFTIVPICLFSCRYKDNNKFVFATVKQRIEKTWYLKEYILNDTLLNINYVSTLKFIIPSKSKINIDCNNSGYYRQYLFDNKTDINTGNDIPRNLKITKLTKNELWLDGYRIIETQGFGLYDKIKVKYSSKP